MSGEQPRKRPFLVKPGERNPIWSLGDLAVPTPEVLGPVAERYWIEVIRCSPLHIPLSA